MKKVLQLSPLAKSTRSTHWSKKRTWVWRLFKGKGLLSFLWKLLQKFFCSPPLWFRNTLSVLAKNYKAGFLKENSNKPHRWRGWNFHFMLRTTFSNISRYEQWIPLREELHHHHTPSDSCTNIEDWEGKGGIHQNKPQKRGVWRSEAPLRSRMLWHPSSPRLRTPGHCWELHSFSRRAKQAAIKTQWCDEFLDASQSSCSAITTFYQVQTR